jgi:hypothetical protein
MQFVTQVYMVAYARPEYSTVQNSRVRGVEREVRYSIRLKISDIILLYVAKKGHAKVSLVNEIEP